MKSLFNNSSDQSSRELHGCPNVWGMMIELDKESRQVAAYVKW
ncbi:hypothetical protein [Photobacterium rosenbergii]|uniref:Uncharacterized protein n=1 Tax=Photobacterium rosenbergii TaxID=294936 RepID=A0ABU3ZJK3_9GAMM|nr:hypothetical protein [Photobacterium rosenbergii]MDV5170296.1 hypothetical protein [Photobacterium rosenbergii]